MFQYRAILVRLRLDDSDRNIARAVDGPTEGGRVARAGEPPFARHKRAHHRFHRRAVPRA